jgi:alginate O-acetyltransferase complex protein AlgI
VIFTEFRFLVFLAVVYAVHWMLRRSGARKAWLLLVSYLFYAAWDWRFLSLIWLSTIVDYGVGLGLRRSTRHRRRVGLLVASVATNLGILAIFKYAGFFASSASRLLADLGLPISEASLDLVLPVGISFYTFQTMSYSIDVFRGRLAPTSNLLDLALFVGFFPQLVAGPIVRASHFLPQLAERRSIGEIDHRRHLALFLVGFVKKAVIADNAAMVADAFFADPAAYGSVAALVGIAAYAVQIYGDFSGYSDMAIASAGLLGYRIPENFRHPYAARSITDFWRRWHISLSTWLRDYLYVPLGGNRGSRWFTYRNVMITMLLGGLWHGAAWTFVLWGALHGIALVIHREWRSRRTAAADPGAVRTACAVAATTMWVGLTWVVFRSPDLETAWAAWSSLLSFAEGAPLSLLGGAVGPLTLLVLLAALYAVHLVNAEQTLPPPWRRANDWVFAIGLGAAVPLVLALVPRGTEPFIYFQF